MARLFGGLLIAISTVLLLLAAHSTYEHFSYLKARNQSSESIRQVPADLVMEIGLAVILFMFGVTLYTPPLKEITWASEMRKRTIDEMNSRPSFAGFNHRGRSIHASS
ncbi:hypothetical protein M407DRAFT_190570 [Tulasnella calospora MUT 4182]|uniref:Membrane magnesium transporter n=1 Tax=Tulasnella calospora MUT 4182 TaxID=1051891 RepID=A0A0C3Q1X7_9AGAM|nr:hypothetical protein M407DRAFT_190570 [Tulasnella calospora MUT 4182]